MEAPSELTRTTLAVLFVGGLIAASFWILWPFLPAIIWATTRPDDITQSPITLRAYDASNPADMLFEAPVGFWQNAKGNPYLTPAVANGKVFVGGAASVTAFGLTGLK